MNRRTFLRRAAIAASAAAVLPAALADPRSIPNPNWVTPPLDEETEWGWVLNPEWVDAPYEYCLVTEMGGYRHTAWPLRWKTLEDAGDPKKCVPPWISWKVPKWRCGPENLMEWKPSV
jgi:hypothetical protein